MAVIAKILNIEAGRFLFYPFSIPGIPEFSRRVSQLVVRVTRTRESELKLQTGRRLNQQSGKTVAFIIPAGIKLHKEIHLPVSRLFQPECSQKSKIGRLTVHHVKVGRFYRCTPRPDSFGIGLVQHRTRLCSKQPHLIFIPKSSQIHLIEIFVCLLNGVRILYQVLYRFIFLNFPINVGKDELGYFIFISIVIEVVIFGQGSVFLKLFVPVHTDRIPGDKNGKEKQPNCNKPLVVLKYADEKRKV